MSELRRSGRSNKGQHHKTADHEYPSLVKRPRPTKKAAKQAAAAAAEPEPEPEDDESEDDSAVRCVCGATEDLGGRMMIECEGCKVWQHNVCMAIPESPDDTLTFHCERCKPELHKELLEAMSRGEKLWEVRLATVDKKKKGKRRSQLNRRVGQKAGLTEEEEVDGGALKRKYDGEERPSTRDEHKRVKSERSRSISVPVRNVQDLVRDLQELGPLAIRAGHFTLPVGASFDSSIQLAVARLEQELATLDDRSFQSRITSIRKHIRSSVEAAGRFLKNETPTPMQPPSGSVSSVEHARHTVADLPDTSPSSTPALNPRQTGRSEPDQASSASIVSRPKEVSVATGTGPTSTDRRTQMLDPEIERILKINGNSLPLQDIGKDSLSAIVRDPSFAFLRTLLQGTQCSVRVSGRFVGGGDFRTLYSLDSLVPKPIELNGRTPAEGGDLYCSLLDPGSMDVMVCSLEPLPTVHDRSRWEYVYQYYQSKSRWGVINTGSLLEPVLDMYVIPLGPNDPFPRFFQKLRFVSIALKRSAPLLLLAIVARTRLPTAANANPHSRPSSLNSVVSFGPEAGGYVPSVQTGTLQSVRVLSGSANGAPHGTPLSATRPPPIPSPLIRSTPITPALPFSAVPSRTGQAGAVKDESIASSVVDMPVGVLPSITAVPLSVPTPVTGLSTPDSGNGRLRCESDSGPLPSHPPSVVASNTHHPSIPQDVLDVLSPLAHLPVVSQLQEANVLPGMSVAKLQTLRAVLAAHPDLHSDLARLVAFLQDHETAAAATVTATSVGSGLQDSQALAEPPDSLPRAGEGGDRVSRTGIIETARQHVNSSVVSGPVLPPAPSFPSPSSGGSATLISTSSTVQTQSSLDVRSDSRPSREPPLPEKDMLDVIAGVNLGSASSFLTSTSTVPVNTTKSSNGVSSNAGGDNVDGQRRQESVPCLRDVSPAHGPHRNGT